MATNHSFMTYASFIVDVTEGEWAGWRAWEGADPFEDHTGAYYWKEDADGPVLCAFRAAQPHMNASGFLHGGAMMTFADYSLFVLSQRALDGQRGVTVTMNSEFVGAGRLGDLVECTGEVVKAGRSMIFFRGTLSVAGEPIMVFSATIKKMGEPKKT